MKKCLLMFIFLLFTIFLALLTDKAPELQVDDTLVANDHVSEEILIAKDLID